MNSRRSLVLKSSNNVMIYTTFVFSVVRTVLLELVQGSCVVKSYVEPEYCNWRSILPCLLCLLIQLSPRHSVLTARNYRTVFDGQNFFKPLRNISVVFISEMSGDFECSELGHIKYWSDYFGQTCNGSSTLLGSRNVLQNFEGTTFYQSTLAQKISL